MSGRPRPRPDGYRHGLDASDVTGRQWPDRSLGGLGLEERGAEEAGRGGRRPRSGRDVVWPARDAAAAVTALILDWVRARGASKGLRPLASCHSASRDGGRSLSPARPSLDRVQRRSPHARARRPRPPRPARPYVPQRSPSLPLFSPLPPPPSLPPSSLFRRIYSLSPTLLALFFSPWLSPPTPVLLRSLSRSSAISSPRPSRATTPLFLCSFTSPSFPSPLLRHFPLRPSTTPFPPLLLPPSTTLSHPSPPPVWMATRHFCLQTPPTLVPERSLPSASSTASALAPPPSFSSHVLRPLLPLPPPCLPLMTFRPPSTFPTPPPSPYLAPSPPGAWSTSPAPVPAPAQRASPLPSVPSTCATRVPLPFLFVTQNTVATLGPAQPLPSSALSLTTPLPAPSAPTCARPPRRLPRIPSQGRRRPRLLPPTRQRPYARFSTTPTISRLARPSRLSVGPLLLLAALGKQARIFHHCARSGAAAMVSSGAQSLAAPPNPLTLRVLSAWASRISRFGMNSEAETLRQPLLNQETRPLFQTSNRRRSLVTERARTSTCRRRTSSKGAAVRLATLPWVYSIYARRIQFVDFALCHSGEQPLDVEPDN